MIAIIITIYSSLTILLHGDPSIYKLTVFILCSALTELLQLLQGTLRIGWCQRVRLKQVYISLATCPSGVLVHHPGLRTQHYCDTANTLFQYRVILKLVSYISLSVVKVFNQSAKLFTFSVYLSISQECREVTRYKNTVVPKVGGTRELLAEI